MRQNQNIGLPAADKIKHLYLRKADSQASNAEYCPFFYMEVRLDFNDVRTGYRATESLNKALEIYAASADLIWAEDMVQDVDPRQVASSAPADIRIRRLPDFVDAAYISRMETQFIQYLLRSYKTKIFRNFELDVYSSAGESLSDFTMRCLDLLEGSKRHDLDSLRDVFNRRLEQIKQKYLDAGVSDNIELAKMESQSKDIFSQYAERIAELFLRPEPGLNAAGNSLHIPRRNLELEERLLALEMEARQAIAKLWDSNRAKSEAIDEYILHPNLKDIHFVRSCILWIPCKGGLNGKTESRHSNERRRGQLYSRRDSQREWI
jgi:hypothetical protein